MASEIQWRGTETGVTLYATIRSKTGTQWNTAGTPNFEAVTAANWADYDVALAESAGNYFYVGTFPAISGNMVAGWYWVDVYKRAGGAPAITDTLQGTIVGYWNGTSLLPWASDATQIKTQDITCAAGVTVRADVGAAAAPGVANGMLIGGSNAATTFASLDVTGALSVGTTTTLTGAVSLGGALTVTGTTTLAAITQTGAVSLGATTFASLTVSGVTTYTGNIVLTDITTAGGLGKRLADIGAYVDCLPVTLDGSTLTVLATAAELLKVPKSDGTATWNATALAAITTQCTLSLTSYDPPTNTEMEARTLVAASYATAAALTTVDTLLDRMAPILIGTVTGAGTGTEVFVYGGVTTTVTVDGSGNRSAVVFS